MACLRNINTYLLYKYSQKIRTHGFKGIDELGNYKVRILILQACLRKINSIYSNFLVVMDTRHSNNSFHNLQLDKNQKGQQRRQRQKTVIITDIKADWILKSVALSGDMHHSEPWILIISDSWPTWICRTHFLSILLNIFCWSSSFCFAVYKNALPPDYSKRRTGCRDGDIILLELSRNLFQIRNLWIFYTGSCPWNYSNIRNLN